ncbi:hypothetical protein WJX81_008625 [Elliptochloris bilobata]|uniref:Glycosyltransferase family 92 protein n=1 Tax=Elliptochloris bilobata TaxID=381761 RepID=A0AAW1QL50_9CHLO
MLPVLLLLLAGPHIVVLGGNAGLLATQQETGTALGSDSGAHRRHAELQRVRQGNVRHYPIPGVLTLRGGEREAVVMHVYIRSQARGDAVVFRGFMFAESMERDWYSLLDGYVCQPDVPQDAWPGITLREMGGKWEHKLRVYTELIFGHQANKPAPGTSNYNRTCMPYPFMGAMSAAHAAADFKIAIDGFKKTAYLSTTRQRQAQARVRPASVPREGPLRAAAIVLYPFTPATDAAVAVALLLQHVAYHLQLGFAKVVQYTQMAFLSAFVADDRLKAYVRAGQLELVLWDHLGECVGPPHMRCWQPIVYSHALLEAWGGGAYLLISDIDEYFVLPKKDTSLAGALKFCTGNKSMVKVERFDVFLSPEAEAALPPGASEVHNGVVFTRNADRTLFWADQKEASFRMNDRCGFLVHLNNLFVSRMRPGDYPVQPDTAEPVRWAQLKPGALDVGRLVEIQ